MCNSKGFKSRQNGLPVILYSILRHTRFTPRRFTLRRFTPQRITPRRFTPQRMILREVLNRLNRQYLPEVLTGEIIFSTIKLDKTELDRWQNLVALSLLQSLERVQLRCNAKESNYNFFFLTVLDNFYYYNFAVKHRRESQQLVNYSAKKVWSKLNFHQEEQLVSSLFHLRMFFLEQKTFTFFLWLSW